MIWWFSVPKTWTSCPFTLLLTWNIDSLLKTTFSSHKSSSSILLWKLIQNWCLITFCHCSLNGHTQMCFHNTDHRVVFCKCNPWFPRWSNFHDSLGNFLTASQFVNLGYIHLYDINRCLLHFVKHWQSTSFLFLIPPSCIQSPLVCPAEHAVHDLKLQKFFYICCLPTTNTHLLHVAALVFLQQIDTFYMSSYSDLQKM